MAKGFAWDSYDGVYRCPICDETWLTCAPSCTKEIFEECEKDMNIYVETKRKERNENSGNGVPQRILQSDN